MRHPQPWPVSYIIIKDQVHHKKSLVETHHKPAHNVKVETARKFYFDLFQSSVSKDDSDVILFTENKNIALIIFLLFTNTQIRWQLMPPLLTDTICSSLVISLQLLLRSQTRSHRDGGAGGTETSWE